MSDEVPFDIDEVREHFVLVLQFLGVIFSEVALPGFVCLSDRGRRMHFRNRNQGDILRSSTAPESCGGDAPVDDFQIVFDDVRHGSG
jgi:hypothetical protein